MMIGDRATENPQNAAAPPPGEKLVAKSTFFLNNFCLVDTVEYRSDLLVFSDDESTFYGTPNVIKP